MDLSLRWGDGGTAPRGATRVATEVRIAHGGFHGGVEMVEAADVASGEIVIQAVTGRSQTRLVWDWFAKYFKLPARHAATEEFHGRRFTLETDPRQSLSIDGEVSSRTPMTVEVAERAIEVVVPA
jgi:diacylglycerol kinase family enzyme